MLQLLKHVTFTREGVVAVQTVHKMAACLEPVASCVTHQPV